jgi:hypothetical protein
VRARHAQHLQPVPDPRIHDALDEHGSAKNAAFKTRFDRFAGGLEWYAEALRTARTAGVPY